MAGAEPLFMELLTETRAELGVQLSTPAKVLYSTNCAVAQIAVRFCVARLAAGGGVVPLAAFAFSIDSIIAREHLTLISRTPLSNCKY